MNRKDTTKNNMSFSNYYEENTPILIRFARRFVSDQIAEDLTQDLFLEVWNKFYPTEDWPSRAYLLSAIRNKCLNVLTREKVRRRYIDATELEIRLLGLNYYKSHDKLIIDKENQQYLYNEIEKLPERCREVFKLSYLNEKTNAEIAERLNVSIRTVEHHLYLGLRALRDQMIRSAKKD